MVYLPIGSLCVTGETSATVGERVAGSKARSSREGVLVRRLWI